MAAPQISVIRGMLVPADAVPGVINLERIETESDLDFAAPINFAYYYYNDGEAVLAIGASVGPSYGHAFGVVRVEESGELTLIDRYDGMPQTPLQCHSNDRDIVNSLKKGGLPCHEKDLATYIVCWFG